MGIEVTRQQASCGALIRGIDLRSELGSAEVDAIRMAWLEHKVVAFPDQRWRSATSSALLRTGA